MLHGEEISHLGTRMLKNLHLAILQFMNLTGKIAKFQKIRIFERNLALNYSRIRKFQMNRHDMNAQKLFSTILKFSITDRERNKIS